MSDRVTIGDYDLNTLYALHVRIVPGLQLSGRLHLADYVGAVPQQLALQDQGELRGRDPIGL